MFACIAINKSAEPDTLAVRVPLEQRKDLIAEAPDTYYLTDHYADYPIALVRLRVCDATRLAISFRWRTVLSRRTSGQSEERVAARSAREYWSPGATFSTACPSFRLFANCF